MNIFIVGVGMGDTKYLTKIAEEKIKNADIIIIFYRVMKSLLMLLYGNI